MDTRSAQQSTDEPLAAIAQQLKAASKGADKAAAALALWRSNRTSVLTAFPNPAKKRLNAVRLLSALAGSNFVIVHELVQEIERDGSRISQALREVEPSNGAPQHLAGFALTLVERGETRQCCACSNPS